MICSVDIAVQVAVAESGTCESMDVGSSHGRRILGRWLPTLEEESKTGLGRSHLLGSSGTEALVTAIMTHRIHALRRTRP